MDFLDELMGTTGLFYAVLEFLQGMMVLTLILGALMSIIPYIFTGYMISCVGKKAGVEEDEDWMAYIPIARQIYQCKILGFPLWYIVFLPGIINTFCMLFLGGIFGVTLGLPVVGVILTIAFWIASLVFRYLYRKELYKKFGFEQGAAWIEFIPVLAGIRFIIDTLIALDKRITANGAAAGYAAAGAAAGYAAPGYAAPGAAAGYAAPGAAAAGGTSRRGFITGVQGKYAGYHFDIESGKAVVFGRSGDVANVVFDQYDTDISRSHCEIRFESASGMYVVTDTSTNGTYYNGNRCPKGEPVKVAPGSVIYLGKTQKNAFRLG